MGAQTCTGCVEDNRFRNRTFKSIIEMEEHFKKYAQDNLIALYGRRLQHVIQKLYTLEQFHLCDLLVKLSCQKKLTQRDDLLIDIEKIDLQQLDHLSSVEEVIIGRVTRPENMSDIYLQQQEEDPHQLKIIPHRNLKYKQEDNDPLENLLHMNKFIVFATIECFSNFNVLRPSCLPSQRSPLQIFLQKIQIINSGYHCSLHVVFIVNPLFDQQFEEEIDRYMKGRDLQSSRDTETSLFDLKYHKILYKPVFPCVDDKGKIVLQNNHLKYNYNSGDLVGFVMKDPFLQPFLQKYDYIQFANLSRLIEEIGERESLIYLDSHPMTSIVAHATEEISHFQTEECVRLCKSFIETRKTKVDAHSKLLKLNNSLYFRSSLFIQQESNQFFHKLISARIKQEPINEQERHFVRKLDQILFSPLTILVTRENISEGTSPTPQIEYSNYCKKRIGLRETMENEMVEMCPQILFGPKDQLKTVVQKLRSLPKIGFPLVVNRDKFLSFRGSN